MTGNSSGGTPPALSQIELPMITLEPRGLRASGYRHPLGSAVVRILSHGGARTLYVESRPACRSLDGIKAADDPRKRCAACPRRGRCTSQVRAEVILDGIPYRLLVTNVSARNLLVYVGTRPMPLDAQIRVLNRGSWGEARFEERGPHGGQP